MLVKFYRDFFAPDGNRYRKGEREVPDFYKDKLPSSAQILKEPTPVKEAPQPTLRDYDEDRKVGESVDKAIEKKPTRGRKAKA